MLLQVGVAGHGFEDDGLKFVVPGNVDGASENLHGAEALGAEDEGGVGELEVGVVDTVPDAVVERLAEGAHEEEVAGHSAPVVALDDVGPAEVGILEVDEADGDFVIFAEEFLGAAFLGLVGRDSYGVEVVAEVATLLLMVAKAQAVKQTCQGATP